MKKTKQQLADYIKQCINNKIFFKYILIDNQYEQSDYRHVIRTKNLFAHIPIEISHLFLNDSTVYCLDLIKDYVVSSINKKFNFESDLIFSDIIIDDDSTYIKPIQIQKINDDFLNGGRNFVKLHHDVNFRSSCIDCSNGIQAFNRLAESINNKFFLEKSTIESEDENSIILITNYHSQDYLFKLDKSVYEFIIIDGKITNKNLIKWFFNQATFEFSIGHVSAIELSDGVNDSLKINIHEL